MSLKASVDIGTNTALLLVASVENQELKVIREEQRVPRLGKGVDKDGRLSRESIERVLDAVKEYEKLLSDEYPDVKNVVVTGTSAVRDAANREELVAAIKKTSGWNMRILSGEEEAEWTFAGALSMLPGDLKSEKTVVLDIGGGSTEVAIGGDHSLIDRFSFSMGSIRFTERFLQQNPPTVGEIEECRQAVRNEFRQHVFSMPGNIVAVGVAGTVTSLAFILQNLTRYEPERISNYRLNKHDIERFIDYFSTHAVQDTLEKWPVVMEGRADVMLAGLLILEEFLEMYSLEEIRVSTGGIRHGAVLL
ncbi:MAG TPA: Ppx/GppA phosphatase family protein [Balneolales bacterium]|nr:Ppx/GppA phosphatase family protein [Balneolales bacterium]